MPELPEMENYRRLLSNLIINKPITNIEINREKSINVPTIKFIEKVLERRITKIERRAKHLVFYLDNNYVLLLHLMLGGWMFYGNESDKPNRTIQVKLSFNNEHLFFIGLRLGYLHLLTLEELEDRLKMLGPEPLELSFTYTQLIQMLSKKRGNLKANLTDQSFISGIGNCYSDEICFSARLLPTRKANSLNISEAEALYNSINSVLEEAIRYGGYMENSLYIGDRSTGGYDDKCRVYDRENEPCVRCGNPIIKEILSSKKSFYCKVCQQ